MSVNVLLDDTAIAIDVQGANPPVARPRVIQSRETTHCGGRKAGGVWYYVRTEGVATTVAAHWRKIGGLIRTAVESDPEFAGMYRGAEEWPGIAMRHQVSAEAAPSIEPSRRLLGRGHWAISGPLAAMMFGEYGISLDDRRRRPIALEDVLLLCWISEKGRQMIVVEADGRIWKHHPLPGGDLIAKKLREFWAECKEDGIESALRTNEVIIFDVEQLGCETRVSWRYCIVGSDNGRLMRTSEASGAWPWEQGPTEQREEARRGSPEGMPMNGPLASAERAA